MPLQMMPSGSSARFCPRLGRHAIRMTAQRRVEGRRYLHVDLSLWAQRRPLGARPCPVTRRLTSRTGSTDLPVTLHIHLAGGNERSQRHDHDNSGLECEAWCDRENSHTAGHCR